MKHTLLLIFLIIFLNSCDENDSSDIPEVKVTKKVPYGENTTQGGLLQELTFDLYNFNDGKAKKPLLILAHGGSFFFGTPDTIKQYSNYMAENGYVVAAMRYRLIDVPITSLSEQLIQQAVVDAIHDMKAVIRYFHKSAEEDNPYNIDTNNIIVGGHSAGAIMGLHLAYLDTKQEVKSFGGDTLWQYYQENGGFSGDSGNQGYSENFRAVLNISGGLSDPNFIQNGDKPIVSHHGTADDVVPYGTGDAAGTGVVIYGSSLIHDRADELGIENKLFTREGGDHIYMESCVSCYDEIRDYLSAFILTNLES